MWNKWDLLMYSLILLAIGIRSFEGDEAMRRYASTAVQFHPHGGQFDFVWLSARTPHGAYVW